MDKQPLNEMANVRNPKLWPDPDTIKMKELYKYKSLDSVKISQTFRNVKSAVPYLCGLGVACLIAKVYAEKDAYFQVFGENGNGGSILDLYSMNTNYDFYYNRQFQRMRYLMEDSVKDPPTLDVEDETMARYGFDVKAKKSLQKIPKKCPHPKYL